MAHTSNKIPMRLQLPDGSERPVRSYQVPSFGNVIALSDGTTTTSYLVKQVIHSYPSALIIVVLDTIDSGYSLLDIRDKQIEHDGRFDMLDATQ